MHNEQAALDTRNADGSEHHQLVIIGGGPGGYVAAIRAAQLGMKVALVEQGEVGGTCLNRGCIPTKTLLNTAELYTDLSHAGMLGISVQDAVIDYDALRIRKEEVCLSLRQGIEGLLKAQGVTLIRGRATVLSATQVSVALCLGTAGQTATAAYSEQTVRQDQRVWQDQTAGQDRTMRASQCQTDETVEAQNQPSLHDHVAQEAPIQLTADNIIIATGTRPVVPPLPGADLPGVYTSDTLLAEVPAVKRLAVIGGGVIGMECASIYTAYGSEVTVLISSDYPLRSFDKELGQSLSLHMKKQGAALITRAEVTQIQALVHPDEQGVLQRALQLTYVAKEQEQTLEVDAVLLAKGREATLDTVLAEGFELACEGGRIAVDAQMCTSVKGVYAIGDVSNAGPELAHAASAEAELAIAALAGSPCTKRLDLVPVCVYTAPEIACVGMTEAEAKLAGITAKTAKYPMGSNAKTLIADVGRSFIKIVTNEKEQVIGAQLMCARATDIIGELTLGVAAGMTVSEMLEIVRPHPTYEEAVGEALEVVTGASIHRMPRLR